jgi:hypothetical protein
MLADEIAGLTRPQDRVLIAGSEPQILYAAKRFSATRFIIVYPMMIPTRFSKKFQTLAIEEIERNKPQVLLVARDPKSWLFAPATPTDFHQYLGAILDRDYVIHAVYVDQGFGATKAERTDLIYPDMVFSMFVRKPAAAPSENPTTGNAQETGPGVKPQTIK